ncbi:syntaphilin isoform X1 [Megalops cyprinoides]|uniref:syntaphilin isoform X1 n=1 Tax=Megalops cyprinoides TaxID=118141 RepID=UPI001864AD7C|nr:syntaphilin isoform X1 [Megalops cyprinoides]XP_036390209.1 syntaphilin isoform X1 [Megalops cyprinoides]XP_036390211.1 syntaphilin isoform X1 [Megalops cyprinoides]
MSAPANRRSAGSRRFNPLKALQPKRRLQQMLSSPSPSVFDYCRFIELDYIPMETGFMVSMRQSRGFLTPQSPERHKRRTAAPVSTRDPYGNSSLSSSSGSCKGSDGSPTPRRHMKYTSCSDNHGIRPPPPEQYLTPLQQKEVCIRHLRARLKETIDRLQDRDSEIEELRTQLSRMQEDWIEEECHRVEAQLALKEARKEIQQLKEVIDVVRTSLSDTDTGTVQKYFQDINVQNRKLESLLYSMELAQDGSVKDEDMGGCGGGARAGAGLGPSGSCDGSPARSLTRSSTYTKLSDQALADKNGNAPDFPSLSGGETQDSGCVCGDSGASRADLLLEAAFLSEETASLLSSYSRMPHSSTYEKLCSTEKMLPLRCGGSGGSSSHPCLAHHHLFLHHLREQAIQTECGPAYNPNLDTITEKVYKSQACSPTSTWLSEEGEDFDTITTATTTAADPAVPLLPSSLSCTLELPPLEDEEALPPQTCQPKSVAQQPLEQGSGVTVVEVEEDNEDEEGAEEGAVAASGAAAPQRSYWSRHFLVDLLAVAMPVVPAMAWLCRAPRREGQPVYNIGSLLRGCCTVALHSLRRGGSSWHYPAGGSGGGVRSTQI